MSSKSYDVAIIGGGPGGSTCGTFLAKYKPGIRVGIFERETFPRDHVGESHLPTISVILDEMDVWNKIEAANFPIKVGATYRWGNSDDLWDFNFLPNGVFKEEPRPGKYEGQRRRTAFQVDRSLYDEILLDHAASLGCEVHENCAVREAQTSGDRITKLVLKDGTEVVADYYVDASGGAGLLRRTMGVEVEEPTSLRNIALWDYWQNAEWAISLGVGGTRVQVMSLGYGWLWFIPINPTRTSVGLVTPAEYYKKTGLKPEELYRKAIADEPRISALLKNATCEHKFTSTKDWSFVAQRLSGENWFLVGEAAGFADPILSAGLTLTHSSAREAAFSILEMGKGRDAWLRREYDLRNRRRVKQHIRFADYWYTANAHFSELKEFTREIARDAGLDLSANDAFQWLGTGGFVDEDLGFGGLALFSLDTVHVITGKLSGEVSTSAIHGYSGFKLNLEGAEQTAIAVYSGGKVIAMPAFRRDGKTLPLTEAFGWAVVGLQHSQNLAEAGQYIAREFSKIGVPYDASFNDKLILALEAMLRDGWITGLKLGEAPQISVVFPADTPLVGVNRDAEFNFEGIPVSLRHIDAKDKEAPSSKD